MCDHDDLDYTRVLVPASTALRAAEGIPDRIRKLRLSALSELHRYLSHYKERGYMENLIYRIAEKKCQMIMDAATKTEMQTILKPRCPHYDGNKFVPDAYHVPEEELIWWSETSLSAPLNEIGLKRYKELFHEVFPDSKLTI